MSTKVSRIHSELTSRIAAMDPHEMLPRELDLADELGVSRSTLREAMRRLVATGLIYSVRGTGTFVSERRIDKGTALSGFSEDMRARGLVPGSRLLSAEAFVAGIDDGSGLGLEPGELGYRINRLRLADGIPMCLEYVELPADSFPGLLTHDISEGLYEILRREYGTEIAVAQQRISSAVAGSDEAALLAISAGESLLDVRRVGYDTRGRPIESALSRYRGDRYQFTMTATRHESE
jgi:GntR family transcriptional regulator